jgi:uncharacterized protein YndB with AHSA1/START domain
MRVEKQVTIAAPPDKVFAYVADFAKHPEWAGHNLEVTLPEGPIAVGTTFETLGHQLGKQNDTITVVELEPGRRLAFETKGKAGIVRHWFEAQDSNGSTTLTKGMEFIKPSMASRLSMPGIRLNVPRMLGKDLDKIKVLLETGTANV